MDYKIEEAKKLMDDFCERTKLVEDSKNSQERYLWTDAFAVQTLFALSHILNKSAYSETAKNLISQVHQTLGIFHPEDSRKGYISGLPENEAKAHPTISGLRIGKKLPERKPGQAYDERLEWERDGQYFHYLTRWVNALLSASEESNEKTYGLWAAELMEAGENFIYGFGKTYGMYWKMNTELSEPLVNSMGAHDPLEGLICTLSVQQAYPEKAAELEPLKEKFISLCRGKSWATTDSLGIGGLLLNALRALKLSDITLLPESVQPKNLIAQSLNSLNYFQRSFLPNQSANSRLAFRECGLTLGIRALIAMNEEMEISQVDAATLRDYERLADEIEGFWMDPDHQKSHTWTEHLNINAITLAASLTASKDSFFFV